MTMDQASSPERIPMHMIDLAHTLQATAALTAPGSRARPPGNARRRRGRSWLVGGAVALLLAAGGCAGPAALDSRVTTTSIDGPRGRTPAEERVIAGVAEMVLTDRAWPDYDRAVPNRINTVADGAPLYVHIRTLRPLGELAHPAEPNAQALFARYPYLMLQVGDVDSMRIVNTCYITLTPEEGRRNELIVALAPMTVRTGKSPTDCWLASVASQPPGRIRQEIRLAGFAGKFESWLPVPDVLAVSPVDADLVSGSALYSAMLRSPAESSVSQTRPSPGSSLSPLGGGASGSRSGSELMSPGAAPAAATPAPARSLPAAPPATAPVAAPSGASPALPSGASPAPPSGASAAPAAGGRGGVSSTPIVVASPVTTARQARAVNSSNAPVRAAMGGDRLEAQLQALATALLGRRPYETYFIDDFWVPAADQRGQFVAEQAYAAAVFRDSSCSWTRLRVLRRPGGANIADLERAGDFQAVNCDELN